MDSKKKAAQQLVTDARQQELINYSDFLLAARSGWRLIFGLILLAVVLSLIYDSRRIPLYEARATIRIGWVPIGSSTQSIEPIKDLMAMVKEEHVLLPLLKGIGLPTEHENISQFRNNLTLSVKVPGSNLVEFKLVSSSRDNARLWLDKLISMKISEHAKILDEFVLHLDRRLAECFKENGPKRNAKDDVLLHHCFRIESSPSYPIPPLVARTIVSESVKVGVAPTFPSVQFLLVTSILGGAILGTLISLVFLRSGGVPRKILCG